MPDTWHPFEPMFWAALRRYQSTPPGSPVPGILNGPTVEFEIVRDYEYKRGAGATYSIMRHTGRRAVTYQIDGPEIVRGPWRTSAEIDAAILAYEATA